MTTMDNYFRVKARIIVVGERKTGKTAFINRYMGIDDSQGFNNSTTYALNSNYKEIKLEQNGSPVTLELGKRLTFCFNTSN